MKKKIFGPHTIFSVENSPYPDKVSSSMGHDEVLNSLRLQGEDAHEIQGHYGSPEKGIIVFAPKNMNAIKDIASKKGQDSILHSTGKDHTLEYLHGPKAGKKVTGTGTEFFKEKPEDFYTTLPSGEHFTHKLNFDDLNKNTLHHYSRKSGLKQLDPSFQGTGTRGAESKHGVPDVRVTYFYEKDTPTEPNVVGPAASMYEVDYEPDKIYDLAHDSHGIVNQLREASRDRQINPGQVTRDEIFGAIKNAGFHGIKNSASALPGAVGLFHPSTPKKENILKRSEMDLKKARVDEGKTPEQKASDRAERHTRQAFRGTASERREAEAGAPGSKGGAEVVGEMYHTAGVHQRKGDFTKPDAKRKHVEVSNEALKVKSNLTKEEDLEKASKNVREQRAKVFGTKSQPPKGSEMREKHMEHIRDYVRRKYGLELQSSGGKWNEETQSRRSDDPEIGVDKPDWRSGQMESQDNPEAQIHEIAHLEELPEGVNLPEGQRLMDRRYTDVQKEHGYMKQKRSQGEIQPMAMENPIRRRMGLPATDISTPVSPGQGPRVSVDTGEAAAVRIPRGEKEVDLIRQSRLRSPENEDRQRQIDEGILTWTDEGWAPGTSADSKINARQYMQEQGADPVEANRIATGAERQEQVPEKLAASEDGGNDIDDETLRQLVQERFGIELPKKEDDSHILKLAEMYAHGSARKFEAPDEAALPNLVKPMEKAIDGKQIKAAVLSGALALAPHLATKYGIPGRGGSRQEMSQGHEDYKNRVADYYGLKDSMEMVPSMSFEGDPTFSQVYTSRQELVNPQMERRYSTAMGDKEYPTIGEDTRHMGLKKARIDQGLSYEEKVARRKENHGPIGGKFSPQVFPKGIHTASQGLGAMPPKHELGRDVKDEDLGYSDMGHSARQFKKPSFVERVFEGKKDHSGQARQMASEKINDLRAMKKPNLPK